MINVFVIKKYAALIIMPIISLTLYFVGQVYYGFLGGLGFLLAGLVVLVPIGNLLLKNPFTEMIEGKGILTLDLTSTGLIGAFIIKVGAPYMWGRHKGQEIKDVFDRNAVMMLKPPIKAKTPAKEDEEGGLTLTLTEEEYNRARFALFHYPVILYNSQIGSVITKDFLSNQEKGVFASHTILYLNRKLEELTSVVRDFGRHVVELLKPQGNIFASKWTWIVIVAILIILGALFAKPIMQQISTFGGAATDAISSGGGGGSILTPRG